jgi:general secretion pathway protein G
MKRQSGFTLIELLVVMAIIALLLSLAMPRYFSSIDRSKEVILKENLYIMRDALQKYYGDKGEYPQDLAELVSKKYLSKIPVDPVSESIQTWKITPPEAEFKGDVYNVHSGASGNASDGTPYSEW